jgi:hypothetical protein
MDRAESGLSKCGVNVAPAGMRVMPSVVTMNWSDVPGVVLCIFSSGRLSAKFGMDPRHRLPATLSKDTRMSGTSLVQQASFLSPGCSLAPLTKTGTG